MTRINENPESMLEFLDNYIINLENRKVNIGNEIKVELAPSLFSKLGYYLEPGTMNIISAASGKGKTCLAFNIATDLAEYSNKKVLYFSLENMDMQQMERYVKTKGNFDNIHLRQGNLDFRETEELIRIRRELEVFGHNFILNTSTYEIDKIREVVLKHKPDVVFVDQASFVSAGGDNDTQRMTNVSKTIKKLAREINIPFILVCQLNREAYKDDVVPKDYMIAGSIEVARDSDSLILLYELKKYDPDFLRDVMTEQEYYDLTLLQGYKISIFILEKSRQTATADIVLLWDGPRFKMFEYGKLPKSDFQAA
jgi:replicative DNA helicase